MKKLKLNMEDLKIESFETSSKIKRQGTAFGHLPPTEAPTNCEGPTCYGGDTCEVSCNYPTCPEWHCDPSNDTCTGPCWWVCDPLP
ncbi:MAG: hypothetical protein PVH88_04050 [Ignavibacteria bacterium]|jgi:hypothetical protein